ncbi:MAG: CocE/NonD family hydrolase [Alphaproteobacteria bacterium]|nr:CocE/NonD family hydrolase [Alphaproteobacteria bacterium]
MTVIVKSFPRKVREIETLWITLADGARLAARVWLPEDAAKDPVPAILEYLPYRRRDGTAVRDSLMHPYVAGHGYACVRVDQRGSGDSDGVLVDEYLKQELDDGVEIIAWLAKQPWCSGNVGMIGNSWGGFNGLQIAALQPPALKAIITSCSTDDRYADDVHYMGGCVINDNLRWASTMFSHNARPPDPTVVGERWREMWMDRLENSGLWVKNWLEHQRRDEFWKHGSVCEDYSKIKCAVYAVGGWIDAYANAIPRLMEHLTSPKKAMIGQWGHRYPHMALPGPPVGFLKDAVRWWDHWLKGKDTGIMAEPMMRIWMQDSVPPRTFYKEMPGRWIGEPSWPPPSATPTRFGFSDGRLAKGSAGSGVAKIRSPQTIGQTIGKWCPYGLFPDMPSDQREEDGGSLVFETAPLEQNVEVLGAPVVELELSSDKPQALVAVRLSNVLAIGAATRVSYGLLNLTHRDSHENPTPLEPGKTYKVRIKLNDLAQVFPAGHRIRVAISTTYWPLAWPSPEAATLTVHGAGSALILPIRGSSPTDAKLVPLPPHELPEILKTTTIRPGKITQTHTRDRPTGALRYVFENDGGTSLIDGIGLESSSTMKDDFSIDPVDPLKARAEVTSHSQFRRKDWNIETKCRTVMTATPTSFDLEATLDAFEGGTRVFAKNWKVSIPRDNV